MEYVNLVLMGILILFLAQRFIPTKGVRHITTDELKKLIKNKNIQFVDVRTPGEFNQRKINQFQNIPLHQLAQKANALSKEKETIVICQSGMRSNKATKILKKLGFKSITNVKGGMSAW
ncbi:rhodanese-like domain-containing protein [Cytobacillus sp. FJAT-54145]|uniref:Rhodanese-like domain-containing protein n=1 Tax=Cytobacillus spartinae TaxID=3299023 RepID=A0ABW6K9A1_9BACI